MATAGDPDIVDYAEARGLVMVTVDTDFPMLIALRRATSPSVVLLRGVKELAPDQHALLVIANLPAVTDVFTGCHRVARTRPPPSTKPPTGLNTTIALHRACPSVATPPRRRT